jgi:DNA-binding GntR family transcriptional regulator
VIVSIRRVGSGELGSVVVHALSLSQTAETATLVEWAKLALSSPHARVLRVTRILFDATDHPLAFEEVVLPLERFPGLSPNGGGDVPDIVELAQRHGISLGRAMERVSIVRATKDVAGHLGIAAGADVMKLDRIVETADGAPIEWRVAYRKI